MLEFLSSDDPKLCLITVNCGCGALIMTRKKKSKLARDKSIKWRLSWLGREMVLESEFMFAFTAQMEWNRFYLSSVFVYNFYCVIHFENETQKYFRQTQWLLVGWDWLFDYVMHNTYNFSYDHLFVLIGINATSAEIHKHTRAPHFAPASPVCLCALHDSARLRIRASLCGIFIHNRCTCHFRHLFPTNYICDNLIWTFLLFAILFHHICGLTHVRLSHIASHDLISQGSGMRDRGITFFLNGPNSECPASSNTFRPNQTGSLIVRWYEKWLQVIIIWGGSGVYGGFHCKCSLLAIHKAIVWSSKRSSIRWIGHFQLWSPFSNDCGARMQNNKDTVLCQINIDDFSILRYFMFIILLHYLPILMCQVLMWCNLL